MVLLPFRFVGVGCSGNSKKLRSLLGHPPPAVRWTLFTQHTTVHVSTYEGTGARVLPYSSRYRTYRTGTVAPPTGHRVCGIAGFFALSDSSEFVPHVRPVYWYVRAIRR